MPQLRAGEGAWTVATEVLCSPPSLPPPPPPRTSAPRLPDGAEDIARHLIARTVAVEVVALATEETVSARGDAAVLSSA